MLTALSVLITLQGPAAPLGYRLATSIRLAHGPGTAVAYLQLLEDKRLTDSVVAQIGENAWQFPRQECAPLCAALTADSARNAVLRLVSAKGIQLAALPLGSAIATLTTQRLRSDSETDYFATIALGGAYAHVYTTVVEVLDDTLADVADLDNSLHSTWRLAPSSSRGQDILEVYGLYGPPRNPPRDTVWTDSTFLTRHHFASGHWHTYTRALPGAWENDGVIPPRDSFP